MPERLTCGNCGGRVDVPAGYAKARIRCGHCGYYADVPEEFRSAAAEEKPSPPPEPPPPRRAKSKDAPPPPPPKKKNRPPTLIPSDARETRAVFVPEPEADRPMLVGTQDEDDDRPYSVEGAGLKPCPECRGELPLDATFCVHCGTSLDDGDGAPRRKAKRNYKPIDESFAEGLPYVTRLALFVAAQVLNVIFTFTAIAASSEKMDAVAYATGAIATSINTVLQAFILGSFDTLRVERTERGKATLTRNRRLFFFPIGPAKVNWKTCAAVGRIATDAGSIFAWFTCIYLLILGCLPGVLFWWFELRSQQSNVVLTNVYGGVEEWIFQSKNEAEAERVAQIVSDATLMKLNRVV